ncbi:MAG TPA: Hsp20/alpha crystallin family protein, partial [Bacteroidia bacterium]|nr:Hsp20/alpha crystallin family protein [Bacteroidia bacterium]
NVSYSSPFGLMDQFFQNSLSRFFDDGFGNGFSRQQVPVNIEETDKSYELEFVAPGLKKEDFKISLDGDNLTVSFEHRQEDRQEKRNGKWLRHEFSMQSFRRSFRLDDSVNPEQITARYEDGVLHLSLPKKEGRQQVSKTIQVR